MVVSNIFYFHPYLGKIPILTNIFGRGWNHQLEKHQASQFLSSEIVNVKTVSDLWDSHCSGLTAISLWYIKITQRNTTLCHPLGINFWCQELWIAAEALRHSETLEHILGLALFIGNYLPLGIPLCFLGTPQRMIWKEHQRRLMCYFSPFYCNFGHKDRVISLSHQFWGCELFVLGSVPPTTNIDLHKWWFVIGISYFQESFFSCHVQCEQWKKPCLFRVYKMGNYTT